MVSNPFKVGDIVELKSGGPPMTVIKLSTNLVGMTEVTCQWFFGKMETATFTPDVLLPSQPLPFQELKGPFSSPQPAAKGS